MADIKRITLGGTNYNIHDETARGGVADLKSALNNEVNIEPLKPNLTWSVGTLNNNTGEEKTATTRIRTNEFIFVDADQVLTVVPPTNYETSIYYWSNGTYTTYDDWSINPRRINGQSGLKLKIVVKHYNDTPADTSVGNNVVVNISTPLYRAIVTDDLFISDYISRNVFNFKPISKTINGVNFTVRADGSILVNGTATARAVFTLFDATYRKLTAYGLKDGKKYILKGCPAGGSNVSGQPNAYSMGFQNSGSPNISDIGDGVSFTVDESSTSTYRPIIDIKSGVACNNLVFYPMVIPSKFYNFDNSYQKHLISNAELEPNEKIFRQYVPILDGQHLMIHRGGSFGAPCNTMPAFELCYNLGYSILEADVQVTSDNIPVIIHGDLINSWAKNADGTTIATNVYVSQSTYSELLNYDFGVIYGSMYAGTKIPTLKEFVQFCKRRNIIAYIDTDITVNLTAHAQKIYDVVKKAGMLQNTIFDCQTTTTASLFTAIDDNLNMLVQGATSEANVDSIATIKDSCKMLIANCGASSYSSSIWTEAFVEYIHDKGLKAKATITNVTKSQADSVFGIGTDFIMCDDLIPYELMK